MRNIKECASCEFKKIGTSLGICPYISEPLLPPSPCVYGRDKNFKSNQEIKKINKFAKGEEVYHKTYKKYGIFDNIDIENQDKAYVYFHENNCEFYERKRVSLVLLKKLTK